jgi:hypothetical protein
MPVASCHCGAVVADIDGDVSSVIECNCSHCRRKGFLLAFLPRDKVVLKVAPGATTTYLFNKHAIEHHFCRTCGVQVHAFGKMPDGAEMTAVNVRCVEGLDPGSLTITPFDGARL